MMNNSENIKWQDQFDRYIEGRLTQDEINDLESQLDEDTEAKTRFVEYLHLHALLQADGESLLAENQATLIEFPAKQRWLMTLRYAAMVSFLLGCVWLLRGDSDENGGVVAKLEASSTLIKDQELDAQKKEISKVEAIKPVSVATLADTRECKWAGSSLPTSNGARLGVGQLHLLEGLATVVFDGGAQVTMEAPALMEVVSADKCRLISGGLVGFVKKGAEGFQVETADALVTDYGTRFGVTVGEDGRSEVVVLEGEVGVTHDKVAGERRLKMGEAARYDAKSFLSGQDAGAIGAEPDRNADLGDHPKGQGWKVLSTAFGQGKDTYVRHKNTGGPFGSSPLVMAKKSADRPNNQRKTYLGFDLQSFNGDKVLDAELVLAIRSSGLGYASLVPNATFTVYGLIDQSQDGWSEEELRWKNAPANVLDAGARLHEDQVVKLGQFIVKQGVASGFRSIEGARLVDFLNEDDNGLATLIIVRETDQTSGNGLVHAFASREHPTAMAPTLRLKFH
ncbi:MAG: DNRLRE domain-containing protein [Verrucomicrobiales bacterium]|nr:DNRLRE domain-containing protein [Verrucomicrobiales bacterium]